MKKILVALLIGLSAGSVAMAQDIDNRPAHKKAQDVYIEPTLRVKTTTITTVVDPMTSEKKVINQKESTKVFNHGGQVIKSDEPVQKAVKSVASPQATTPPLVEAKVPVAQVPAQKKVINNKEITNMNRPKP